MPNVSKKLHKKSLGILVNNNFTISFFLNYLRSINIKYLFCYFVRLNFKEINRNTSKIN